MRRLQEADRALGGPSLLLLAPAARLRASRAARPPARVLLVKFWGLGSLQLLTPAVRVLRRRHPGARLELLTLRRNAPFARGLGVFDDVLALDVSTGSWIVLAGRLLGLLRALRRARYDTVYDFEFLTIFSAVVSLLSGAPRSSGFSSPETRRARLHTRRVPFRRDWHVARNFKALAGDPGEDEVRWQEIVPFRVRAEHRSEAAAALFEHGFSSAGPLVVLNPNAGDLSLERRWPAERFAELARLLVREDGARVVLVGTGSERPRTAEVARLCGPLPADRLADLAGRLSVGGTLALLAGADVFVTNDSGPMHLAAAQGVPTIGLFGPETPAMYAPVGPRTRWLYRPTACSPCINVHDNKLAVCVRGRAECMANIDVELALAAARAELCRPRTVRALAAEPASG